eukprot:scpid735/ scgid2341/ 
MCCAMVNTARQGRMPCTSKPAGSERKMWKHDLTILLVLLLVFVSQCHGVDYYWKSATTGNWEDASNWNPSGVPDASDSALITPSGTYTVTLNSDRTVRSLDVGAGTAQVSLFVEQGTVLNVTEQLNVVSPDLRVYGQINVKTFLWSGKDLAGILSYSGKVIVSDYMRIAAGSYSSKYLKYITVTILKNLTFDPASMDSTSAYFYCQQCTVVNERNSTLRTGSARWSILGTRATADPVDGYRQGLINYGTFVVEMTASTSVYNYWDVRNHGRLVLLTAYWNTRNNFYLDYVRWVNLGSIESYWTSIRVRYTSVINGNGTIAMYSQPFRSTAPLSNRKALQWRSYISELLGNTSYHAFGQLVYLPGTEPILGMDYCSNQLSIEASKLTVYGGIYTNIQSSRNSWWKFDSVEMTASTRLYQSSSSSNNTIVLGDHTQSTLGIFYGRYQLRVRAGNEANVTFLRSVLLTDTSEINIGANSQLVFRESAQIHTSASVVCGSNSTITFNRDLDLSGALNVTQSTVTVLGQLQWTQGSINGNGSSLVLSTHSQLSGDRQKILKGTKIILQQQPISPTGTYLAEYFQYRVQTPTTPRLSNIYYFPTESSSSSSKLPVSYDNASSIPTLTQIEDNIQHLPQYYGSSPLRFLSSSSGSPSWDSASALSFTYNYAARYWFYLQIDAPGSYYFYFAQGYSVKLRMYVDGTQIYSQGFYSSFPPTERKSSAVNLISGQHIVHIDYIVQSTYWSDRGMMFTLSYEGPTTSKQPIPPSKMSAYRTSMTGARVYANAVSSYKPNNSVTLDMSGNGLLLATDGSSLALNTNGVLRLLSDIIILSYGATGSIFQLTNGGEIIKDGTPGVAALYVDYQQLAGGKLTTTNGQVEFRDLNRDGGLATWNNPAGGKWTDGNNWIPARAPRKTDVVFITLSGSYSVTIPGSENVTVLSLVLGAQGSNPSLQVSFFSNLNILDKFDVQTQDLTISGNILTKNMAWSGQKITGDGFSPSLRITYSFSLIWSSYTTKHLTNIIVENQGNATVDGTSSSPILYCTNCRLVNAQGATLVTPRMSLSKTSGACSSPGSQLCSSPGLINYGTVIVQVQSSSTTWTIDVYNTGNIKAIGKYPTSTSSWQLSSNTFNGQGGTLDIYMVQLTLSYTARDSHLGSVRSYSWPVRATSLSSARGARTYDMWEEYLADLFTGSLGNDVNTLGGSVYIKSLYGTSRATRTVTMTSYEAFGRCKLRTETCQYSLVSITDFIRMDVNSEIQLVTNSARPGELRIGSKQASTIGSLSIEKGWSVQFTNTAAVSILRDTVVSGNASLVMGESINTTFFGSYQGQYNSLLQAKSGNVRFSDRLRGDGNLQLGKAQVTMLKRWSYNKGDVTGNIANITASGGLSMTGSQDKVMKNVRLNIQVPTSITSTTATSKGVLVEYFQFRVKNSLYPQYSSLYSFPSTTNPSCTSCLPSSFDQASAAYNDVEIRHSVNHPPQYKSFAPLDYLSNQNSYNSSSPMTFTYNFATRWWFFLDVPTSTTYTFSLQTAYSVNARLWVDGVVKGNTGFYKNYYTSTQTMVSVSLLKGMREIRLDLMVQSTYWDTRGNGFTLHWETSDTVKEAIPDSRVFFKYNGKWAQPYYNSQPSVILTPFDAKFSGYGLVLAQDTVAVTIASNSVFDVQSDAIWQCLDSSLCTFTNNGVVRRSGTTGPAYIYTTFTGTGTSTIDRNVSSLTIESVGSASGLVSWTSTTGGLWSTPSNWNSGRVPTATDSVYINLPGNYTIVLLGGTHNISSLVLGSASSFPTLQINHFCTLNIAGRMDIRTDRLIIQGILKAKDLTWSGESIEGSTLSFANSKLVVTGSLLMQQGVYTRKYFKNISIENYGKISEDASITSTSYIYMNDAILTNFFNATLELQTRYLQTTGSKVTYHLINFGTVILYAPSSSSKYLYWKVRNVGDFYVFPPRASSSYTTYLYSAFENVGRLSSYNVQLRVRSNGRIQGENGTWSIYGGAYQATTTDFEISKWREYIRNPYNETTIYSSIGMLEFYSVGNDAMKMHTLRMRGAYLRLSNCYNVSISIGGVLDMDESSRIDTMRCVRMPCALSVNGNASANHTIGLTYLDFGWNVSIKGESALFRSGLTMKGGSRLDTQTSTALFHGPVRLDSTSSLELGSSSTTFGQKVQVEGGTMKMIDSPSVTFQDLLSFGSGSIIGPGFIQAQKEISLSSSISKTLDSVDITLAPRQFTRTSFGTTVPLVPGVIAEYFQYRVPTPLTPQLSNIYYYYNETSSSSSRLPASFDDPNSQPNIRRFEQSLQRPARYLGRAPLVLSTSSTQFDLNAAGSFTYNYAMRLWTYVSVMQPGQYTFLFKRGYSTKVRLWINNKLTTSGSAFGFYRSIYQPLQTAGTVTLSKGLNLLRLDCIIQSTYWQYRGNGLELYWNSTFTGLQRIPDSLLVPIGNSQPAAPGLKLTTASACSAGVDSQKFPFSFSRLRVTGTGPVQFRGTSSLDITSQGILELQTSRSWQYSSSSGTGSSISQRLNLTVNGLVSRPTGTGELNLNAQFSAKAGSCINVTSGTLLLGVNGSSTAAPIGGTGSAITMATTPLASTAPPTTPPAATTVFWSGSGGTIDWDDPSNWTPRKPSNYDTVVISQPGALTINLQDSVTVTNLTLGTSTYKSNTLQILSGGSLRVLDTFTIYSRTLYVYGLLDANKLLFSGTSIYGALTSATSTSPKGQITVRDSMYVSYSNSKTLSRVILTNHGNLTFAPELNGLRTTCIECQIINERNATFLTNTMSWFTSGDVDASRPHLINRGMFIMASTSPSSITYQLIIQNFNQMVFVYQTTSQSAISIGFSNPLLRVGRIRSYFCHLTFTMSSSITYTSDYTNSSLEVYSFPRFTTSTLPRRLGSQASWQAYITDIFSTALPNQWSRSRQILVQISSLSSYTGNLPSCKLNGYVQLRLVSSNQVSVRLSIVGVAYSSLYLATNVNVYAALVTSTLSEVIVADGSRVNMSTDSTINNSLRLRSQGSMYLYDTAAPPKPVSISSVTIGTSASLNMSLSSLSIYHLDLYGTMNSTWSSTTITVRGVLRWQGGTILGQNSNVMALGPCNITGKSVKTLQNVTLTIANRPATLSQTMPVLTQIFQYRVPTPKSTFVSTTSLFYFFGYSYPSSTLPQDFDNLTAIPTINFASKSLGQSPNDIGLTPIMYSSNGNSIDTVSPWSFTERFAVRKLSYLSISTAGNYQFFIEYRYGSMRLSLDNNVIINPQSRSSSILRYSSAQMTLTAGLHLIRVDFIVSVDAASNDNAYTIYYSGPGFANQSIPDSALTVNPTGALLNTLLSLPPNVTQMSDEGLMFSRSGATVTVESNRHLEFVSDFLWLSLVSGTQLPKLVNYGNLLKTGGGIASLTLQLNNKASGSITNILGQFAFSTPTTDSSAYFWQNPIGGTWTDPNNWLPSGIPGPKSSVFITLEGNYQILLPFGSMTYQVENLQIGSGVSQPELNVGLFAKLIVTDHLEVHSNRLTIDGEIQTSRFTWSGTYLIGKTVTNQGGVLTVQKTFLFAQSPTGTAPSSRYVQDLTISNMGLMQASYQLVKYLYCSACILNNHGTLILQSQYLYLQSGVGTMNNYGNFTMEIGVGTSSTYNYWTVTNQGKIVLASNSFSVGSRTYYAHGEWTNNGTVDVYMVTYYMYGTSTRSGAPYSAGSGKYRIWSKPLQNNSMAAPPNYYNVGGSTAFLAAAYSGHPIVWDPTGTTFWYIQNFFGSGTTFGEIETYGRVTVLVRNSPGVAFYVSGSVSMPALSLLDLSTASLGASFTVLRSATRVSFGSLQMQAGWALNCQQVANVSFAGRTVLGANSSLDITGTGGVVQFLDDLYINSNTSLIVQNATVDTQQLRVDGVVRLHDALLNVHRSLVWTGGSLVGNMGNDSVRVTQDCRLSSQNLKALDGLTLVLSYAPVFGDSSNGVIAEYYQYRVANQVTSSPPSSPRLCAPCVAASSCSSYCINPTFDDTTIKANIVRLEKDITRPSTFTSLSPQDYQAGGILVNSSSPTSFTSNYAVRWSSYLKIDTAGTYTFFSIIYSAYTRLWVNSNFIQATSSTSSVNQERSIGSVTLSVGYVHLRFEALFTSTSSYSNPILLRYEGPSVPKQNIPASKLFYRTSVPTWRTYASTAYTPLQVATCVMAENSLNLINNKSLIDIAATGVLDIQQDIFWYSQTFATAPSSIINRGVIKKTAGMGAAVFTATLFNRGGSLSGNVQFGSTSTTSVAYWNNPNGGSWHHASNWLPARVPLSTDNVFITLSGSYKVVISASTPVTVNSLEVGGPNSKPTLVIDHYTSVNISNLWVLRSPDILIYGTVQAGDIKWVSANSRMTGPMASSQRGFVTFNTMTVLGEASSTSSSQYRYLSNVTLTCRNALTWNQSVTFGYCERCHIIINADATMTFATRYWNTYGSYVLVPGVYSQGITNYGTIAFLHTSSISLYNDILNYGTIHFASRFLASSTISVFLYTGSILNYGTINTYHLYMYINTATIPFVASGGKWNFWGFPMGIPYSSLNPFSHWPQLIEHYYSWTLTNNVTGLPRLWSLNTITLIQFRSSTQTAHFRKVQIGGCHLDMYARKVTIHESLAMDEATQWRLRAGTAGLITLESKSTSTLSTFIIPSGWTIDIKSGSTVKVLRQLALSSGSSILVQNSSARFVDTAMIAGSLVMQDSKLWSSGRLTLQGRMTLKRSTATLNGSTLWQQGILNGTRDSSVILETGGTIQPTALLKISSVQIRIQATNIPQQGVMAEYFQYRIATTSPPEEASTPVIQYLQYFPASGGSSSYYLPASFNDPAARPTLTKVESQLGWAAQFNSHGPVEYTASGTIDTLSTKSFTYNYAVRYWAFLSAPVNGTYTFYFSASSRKPIRLWINDLLVSAINVETSWPGNVSVTANLMTGMNRLRLDLIQRSANWNANGNMLMISYEGPCTPLQTLRSNLYTGMVDSNGTMQYASKALRAFSTSQDALCSKTSFTASQLCNYDFGVSCLQQIKSGTLSFENSPFIYVSPSGILNFAADPTLTSITGGGQLGLLVTGILAKSAGTKDISLSAAYNITGCQRTSTATGQFTLSNLTSVSVPSVAVNTVSSRFPDQLYLSTITQALPAYCNVSQITTGSPQPTTGLTTLIVTTTPPTTPTTTPTTT